MRITHHQTPALQPPQVHLSNLTQRFDLKPVITRDRQIQLILKPAHWIQS